MPEPHTAALLVDYFETFLRDKDLDAFRASVQSRYTDGTLTRLTQAGGVPARRAAVLALGLAGTINANAAVARTLRDPDPVVRSLAQDALWSIWCRADTPENNALLREVQALLSRGRAEEAHTLATRLIARAPRFAEAHNQRAIAAFQLGRWADSAEDCRHALELNPYHFGALGGLGQCYQRLGRRADALATYRRALKLQPYSDALKETVAELEGGL